MSTISLYSIGKPDSSQERKVPYMTSNSSSPWLPRLSRRTFLRIGGLGSALVATGVLSSLLVACGVEERPPSPPSSDATIAPDLEFALRAIEDESPILPGASTKVWRYSGEVLGGDASALQMPENSYLGPIMRIRQGQKVRIRFQNELPEESIVHWHGLIVGDAMDGHPRYAVASGAEYLYEFEVKNRAGAYWFHPHPHGRTGPQVYRGLAGLLLVTDAEEAALNLPGGAYDIPLVLQDRLFDEENQFRYLLDEGSAAGGMGGMSGMAGHNMGNIDAMMAQMMGQRGDRILVNGQIDATLVVEARPYRLRVVNGSNSRIYKLAWSDLAPLTAVAIGGGLLAAPVTKPYIILAPGERVELWADFSNYAVGGELKLQSLEFASMEMGDMMMGNDEILPSGAPFDIMTIRVESATSADMPVLPDQLATIERLDPAEAVNAGNPYRVELYMDEMIWEINGRTFELEEAAEDERFQLNGLYLWEFVNLPGRGMMADFMAHPMHIHGVQFQVVSRQIDPQYEGAWQTLAEGIIDEGWHDTVLVAPGERVQVIMRFTEPGLFPYHCHILEHEDGGMMRNFLVA